MKTSPLTTGELAVRLGCRLHGSPEVLIRSAAPIDCAEPDQLTFLANPRYRRLLPKCRAGAVIAPAADGIPAGVVGLITDQPYPAFCRALETLYPEPRPDLPPGAHPTASVHPSARLGDDVRLDAFVQIEAGARVGDRTRLRHGVYIGRDATVGQDCDLGVNVVLRHEVQLGNRVVVGDGTVIGFDGFGYVPVGGAFHKIPQVGTVVVEDDVEIGANCCIDRATVGETRIRRGARLDNLIQVAHGVEIGEHTVIAAQTGISGSSKVGAHVMMGGQVGVAGHLRLGDGMIVGAQAGVTKSYDIKGMISGYPARPQAEELRTEALVARLPELFRRLKELEDKLRRG